MKTAGTTHLNEEALNDVLIGMASEESRAHLALCPACRARAGALTSAIAQLDAASMAWSRQRAAQMPDPPVQSGAGRFRVATMGWAASTVLLVALAIPVWHRLQQPKGADAPPATAHSEDSELQIAQDNALMHEVDAAINTTEASPLGNVVQTGRPLHTGKARPE